MFSKCANPECSFLFDYRRGQFFRFHKYHADGEEPPNTHSVQHFWLCAECSQEFTLEYSERNGVVLKNRPDVARESEVARSIAAA
jgi:hypothetical protein